MFTPHGLERMVWDAVPVADTRPAMKGGVPFWALLPIFFTPAILVVLTWNIFWMLLIPGLAGTNETSVWYA